MVEDLLPAAACSEMFSDVPESAMFPAEALTVGGAGDERRREFGTVRYCARQALSKLGVTAAPILPDADGVPQWPSGVVGSMTHCKGYRAAVVARASELRSLGIDAEPNAPLPSMLPDLVLRDEEQAQLRQLAESFPRTHWDRIAFCAKEAVFKAWFPIARTWLDFDDVSVSLHPDNAFSAFVYAYPAAGIGPAFVGRWMVSSGIIIAATWIRPGRVRTESARTFVNEPVARQGW
jgi:4'-phosphopantetheinyl transferase EntD